MLAAGIGVAPFRSVILENLKKNPARRIVLLYSSRTMQNIVFRRELEELAAKHEAFEVHHFITREENLPRESQKAGCLPRRYLKRWGMHPTRSFYLRLNIICKRYVERP